MYAVDDHQHLIGRVPLRRLLLADPRSLILGILDAEEVVSVNATMDKEEVARVVAKYDLVTVPVVDDQNRLVGTITVDDVMDVVQEEASEDIFRMAGSDAAELERRSPRQVAMLRLPWVLLTLLVTTGFASGISPSAFGEDLSGEIYVVDYTGGGLYELAVTP